MLANHAQGFKIGGPVELKVLAGGMSEHTKELLDNGAAAAEKAALERIKGLVMDERAFRVDSGEVVMVTIKPYWEARVLENLAKAGGEISNWRAVLNSFHRVPEDVHTVKRLWNADDNEAVYMYRQSRIIV